MKKSDSGQTLNWAFHLFLEQGDMEHASRVMKMMSAAARKEAKREFSDRFGV